MMQFVLIDNVEWIIPEELDKYTTCETKITLTLLFWDSSDLFETTIKEQLLRQYNEY